MNFNLNINLQKWPREHRILLGTDIVLLILCLLAAFFYLKPRWVQYVEERDEKASLEARLNKSEWPKDSERLKAMLKDFNKKLDKDNGNGKGLKKETTEILTRATELFKDKIVNEYGSVADFMQKASQTEYKDQFDKLDTYFQGKNIYIERSYFGMDELTSEPFKYQMLLKLWTTQAVVDCALKAKLKIITRPLGGGNRGRRASHISVLPMNSYVLNQNESTPYLLEFPVNIELTGTLDSFSAFVDSLFANGRFLPMTKMELVAQQPNLQKTKPDADGRINTRAIAIRVVCSSFFLPAPAPMKEVISTTRSAVGGRPPGL